MASRSSHQAIKAPASNDAFRDEPVNRFSDRIDTPGFRLAAFVLVLLTAVAVGWFELMQGWDLKLLDTQFRQLRIWHPRPVARDVVVIGIDEDTAESIPEPFTLWHRHFGSLFAAMTLAKPAALGVDVVLPSRSYEPVAAGLDRELMKGILTARGHYPLTLAITIDPAGRPRPIHPAFIAVAGADATGFALFPVDGDDTVRRFEERLGDGGKPVPTLVGQMARQMKVEPRNGYIDYSRGPAFSYLPMKQVLQWATEGNEAALVDAFRGKPVLLGTVFPFEDRLRTPVALAAWGGDANDTPGVLIHAQALRNQLNDGVIQPAPAAWITALCALLALFCLWPVSTRRFVAVFAAAFIIVAALSTALLMDGTWLPVAAPLLSFSLAFGARHLYDTLLKLRERRILRASFSGSVSPTVMKEILAGRISPELGGTQETVCVLFSDIRGFTTRSERMTPEETIKFLNRYFETVVSLIHQHDGCVASFIGDGIMAVFGAPKRLENPCAEAFASAKAMLDFVADLNRQFVVEGTATMDIGIGLQVGEAVMGHVGSRTRHDFTAIGDVTNVASRLESLTKEAGYRIVVSKTVADQLGADAGLTALGEMAIKGHTPVNVYGYEKI